MNEWQIWDKEVKIISPEKFMNGAYKTPKISIHSLNSLGSTARMQTTIQGYIMFNKIRVYKI